MPRRNGQRMQHQPLDVTPPSFNKPQRLTKDHDRAAAAKTQHQARIDAAIDWSVCIVPGCGEQLGLDTPAPYKRNPDAWLPICYVHRAVVVRMSQFSVNHEPDTWTRPKEVIRPRRSR